MASQMLGIAQGSDTKAVALISERNLAISSVTRAAFVLIEMFIWLALRSLREFLRELKTNNGYDNGDWMTINNFLSNLKVIACVERFMLRFFPPVIVTMNAVMVAFRSHLPM